jgi:carbamoyl-phosphate synthase large subunit
MMEVAAGFAQLGFSLVATEGTARALCDAGLRAECVHKIGSGTGPTVLDAMRDNRIQIVLNTPSGVVTRFDEVKIRSEAVLRDIPIVTTESGARATLDAIRFMKGRAGQVRAIQDYVADARRLREAESGRA